MLPINCQHEQAKIYVASKECVYYVTKYRLGVMYVEMRMKKTRRLGRM